MADSRPSFLQDLSTSLGRTLNTMAENRLQGLSRRSDISDISTRLQGLGIPRADSDFIATLPPQQQFQALQFYNQPQQAEQVQQPQSQSLSQLPFFQQQAQAPAPAQQQSAAIPGPVPVQEPQQMMAQPQQSVKPAAPKSTTSLLKNIAREKASEKGEMLSNEQRKEQHKVDKETLPYYNQIKKEAKGAKDNNKRLNRMEELIKKGNLPSGGWGSILRTFSKGAFGIGLDLGFLTHADSQEFNKISQDFIKGAKDIFGSRLTDADLNAFLQTIPTLSLSNEGKMRVINNLKAANEAAILRDEAVQAIIKHNGGHRPPNIDMLVEDLIKPDLDQLADTFKESNIPKVEEPFGLQLAGKPFRGLPGIF